MPVLILARHGNTFEKDQTPTWVGAKTDLPLTSEGEAQAQRLADLIAKDYAPLGAIIAGPLKRTQRMAEIVGQKVNNIFTIDERLTEIDYGLWENKSGEDIARQYGREILEKWEQEGVWPEDMLWAPSEDKLIRNISHFLEEQHKRLGEKNAINRLAITSNGILRFVYRALTGKAAGTDAKVKTGAYCVLEPTATGWTIKSWNTRP